MVGEFSLKKTKMEIKLPKYKYLLTYRFAEIIHDLTVEFCQRFLSLSSLGHLSYLSYL